MTLIEAAASLGVTDKEEPMERCPQCDGPMERVTIDGHDSWTCPKDAYAYTVDQDDEDWYDAD